MRFLVAGQFTPQFFNPPARSFHFGGFFLLAISVKERSGLFIEPNVHGGSLGIIRRATGFFLFGQNMSPHIMKPVNDPTIARGDGQDFGLKF
ncbi:MAG: hypothetical protein LBT15_06790 [Synergistaceae bacterium]|nr:hypothetical protein [Synergistaceae bacterium]